MRKELLIKIKYNILINERRFILSPPDAKKFMYRYC